MHSVAKLCILAIAVLFASLGCKFFDRLGSATTPTPFEAAATALTPTQGIEPAPTGEIFPTQTRPAQAVSTIPPNQQTVNVFLIALEDQGKSGRMIGCGDSLIPVAVQIAPTQAVLRAAIQALLDIDEQYYGQSGLYNALYQSNLQIEDVRIESGIAEIQLSGQLLLGGVCDNPRVEEQLTAIAMQFGTVRQVAIWVNGIALEELLSEK